MTDDDDSPINLPDGFWSARKVLSEIRRAAHSRGRSADLVFAALMARVSAMRHHRLMFDVGFGVGSLNLFVAAVGPSGVGKTTGCAVAADLLPVPGRLQPAGDAIPFRDGVPLGSGEGLAEAFMGTVSRETGEMRRDGTPRVTKVRAQIRHNVLIYADEGETLVKIGERSGAVVGPVLRSAWVGAVLGQSNATDERTRIVPAGSYALGLVVGLQRATALPLLEQAGPGTPQRFVWVAATDPAVPTAPPDSPSRWVLDDPTTDRSGAAITGVIGAEDAIRRELWERTVARVHGAVVDDDLDSHESVTRLKVAALLAVLDRRMTITMEDWDLAAMVWRTSCAVRDSLVAHGRSAAAADAEERTRRYLDREVRKAAAVQNLDATLARIARLLAAKADEAGKLTHGAARRALPGRDRGLYDDAVAHGVTAGLLRATDAGIVPAAPGLCAA